MSDNLCLSRDTFATSSRVCFQTKCLRGPPCQRRAIPNQRAAWYLIRATLIAALIAQVSGKFRLDRHPCWTAHRDSSRCRCSMRLPAATQHHCWWCHRWLSWMPFPARRLKSATHSSNTQSRGRKWRGRSPVRLRNRLPHAVPHSPPTLPSDPVTFPIRETS